MLKTIFTLSFFCCFGQLVFAQETAEKIKELEKQEAELAAQQLKVTTTLEDLRLQKIREDIKKVGLPVVKEGLDNEVVEHGALILGYNESHEQANWVSHVIIPAVNKGKLTRTNDFRRDSLVSSGSAVKADYWYSGYDRGHLAPSADFRWSRRAISESYVYSNMAPQKPELNRESWAALEGFVRKNVWVNNEQLILVTGPVFSERMETITQGPNVVSIPEQFYKVILDVEGDEKKAIAFLMSNGENKKSLISYATTVDEVEKLTGLDFFPELDDALEKELEGSFDFSKWEGMKEGEIPSQEPLTTSQRPKNTLNSVEADLFVNKKACVCGMVVSTRKTDGGSVFFNFDQKFPNHTFSGSIWASNIQNFSYDPEIEFLGKKICITGKITDYKGKPTMNIEHEKRVSFLNKDGKEMPR